MNDEVRYPDYDVLDKRDGMSWNDATRRTIAARLALPRAPGFFSQEEWLTLQALCARIVPQVSQTDSLLLAAMLDARLQSGRTDGFRRAELPQQDEAWRRGLGALTAEARSRHGGAFGELEAATQDELLRQLQAGHLTAVAWGDMSGKAFFEHRVLPDLTAAYYALPHAWNEIGFGGPASPRGYVRMDFDRRDPWEAAQATPGHEDEARRDNQRVR